MIQQLFLGVLSYSASQVGLIAVVTEAARKVATPWFAMSLLLSKVATALRAKGTEEGQKLMAAVLAFWPSDETDPPGPSAATTAAELTHLVDMLKKLQDSKEAKKVLTAFCHGEIMDGLQKIVTLGEYCSFQDFHNNQN